MKSMQEIQEQYNEAHREYAPVVHAKWIYGKDIPEHERKKHPYMYLGECKYCSNCFAEAYWDTDYGQQLFDYCPYCGARMDL